LFVYFTDGRHFVTVYVSDIAQSLPLFCQRQLLSRVMCSRTSQGHTSNVLLV